MSTVVPFPRPASAQRGGWSQQELAEFYRVEAALVRAGIGIASAHGLSDEGEPWFVFCRPDGDAIIHFARIDGSYLIASGVLDHPVRGPDFRALIDQIARLHPDLLPIPAAGTGTRLVVHPAALLAALVAAAAVSLSSEEARAGVLGIGPDDVRPLATSDGAAPAHGRPQPARAAGGPGEQEAGRKQFEALVLSAMIFAAEAVAGDHRAAGAEPDLALADPAGGAASRLAQGDAPPGSGAAPGSGSGAASAAQPAVPTVLGSGASPGGTAAASRIDAAPTIRADLPGDRPAPPAPEAGFRPPDLGIEARPGATPTEARATGTGTQPAAATGRAETAAATPEGPGAATSAQRAGSAPAQSADPGAQARSAEAAPSDSGVGGAQPGWVGAVAHTVVGRMPVAPGTRDADGREAGKDPGSRLGPAAGDHPPVERTGRGSGRDDGQDKGNGPRDSQGHGQEHGQGRGQEHGQAHGQGRGSEAGPAADDRPQVGQAGRGGGQGQSEGDGQGRGHVSQAEPAIGETRQNPQAGQGNGQSQGRGNDQGSGQSNSHASQAEPAAGETQPVEQAGRGNGQSQSNGQGHGRGAQSEPVAGDAPQPEQAARGQGQGQNQGQNQDQGNGSQAHPAARSEAGAGTQSTVVPATGDDSRPGRADDHGHRAAPAERSDQRGPDAHDTRGADPDAGAPAHASADPAAAGRGPDRIADGRGAAADHGAGPPTEHARGGPSDGGRGAPDPTVPFEQPKGNPSDAKAHGGADAVTAHAPADSRAEPAEADVMHPHAGAPPHAQNPDAADHGPPPKAGPAATGEHPGPGPTPASSVQDPASGDEHGRSSQPSADHGPGRAVGAAAGEAAAPQGADDGGLSAHPRGPDPTASPAGSASTDHGRGKGLGGNPAGDRADQGAAPSDQAPAAQPRPPSDGLPPPGKIASAGAPGGSPDHAGQAADPAGPPRAAIDAGGNLVFHADSQPATAPPAAPHGPDEPAAPPQVGLVGISDHAHPVHDLYHHG